MLKYVMACSLTIGTVTWNGNLGPGPASVSLSGTVAGCSGGFFLELAGSSAPAIFFQPQVTGSTWSATVSASTSNFLGDIKCGSHVELRICCKEDSACVSPWKGTAVECPPDDCCPAMTVSTTVAHCDPQGKVQVTATVSFQAPPAPCAQNSLWVVRVKWGDSQPDDFLYFSATNSPQSATHSYQGNGSSPTITVTSLSSSPLVCEKTVLVTLPSCDSPNCQCPSAGSIEIDSTCFDLGKTVPIAFVMTDPSQCVSEVVWHIFEQSGPCSAQCGPASLYSSQWSSPGPSTTFILDPTLLGPGQYNISAVAVVSDESCCKDKCPSVTFASNASFSIRPKECPQITQASMTLTGSSASGYSYDCKIDFSGDTSQAQVMVDFGDGPQTKCLCGTQTLDLSHTYPCSDQGKQQAVSISLSPNNPCCQGDVASVVFAVPDEPCEKTKEEPASCICCVLMWIWLIAFFITFMLIALPASYGVSTALIAALAIVGAISWMLWLIICRPSTCSVVWNFYVLFWWCWYIGTYLGYFVINPIAWATFLTCATAFNLAYKFFKCPARDAFLPIPVCK